MIALLGYSIKIFYNDTDLDLNTINFTEFRVFESLNYNIYFGELKIRGSLFYDGLMATGDKIKIEIHVGDEVTTYEFIVFEYNIDNDNNLIITLVPKCWHKLYGKKYTQGYNDKLENIVETIISEIGLSKKYVASVNPPKRLFLQLNQSYFNFLKYLSKYVPGSLMFINPQDELTFTTYSDLIDNGQIKGRFNAANFIDLKVDNKSLAMQYMGGLGATGYYFDWDNAAMETFEFAELDGYGINSQYQENLNNIVMSNPIGTDVYAPLLYSENLIADSVLNKNLFKVYINFIVKGQYDLSVGDKIDILFPLKNFDGTNEVLSGEYIIFAINTSYQNMMETNIVCGSPFLKSNPENWS